MTVSWRSEAKAADRIRSVPRIRAAYRRAAGDAASREAEATLIDRALTTDHEAAVALALDEARAHPNVAPNAPTPTLPVLKRCSRPVWDPDNSGVIRLGTVDLDMCIGFAYDAARIDRLKSAVPYARWDRGLKVWRVTRQRDKVKAAFWAGDEEMAAKAAAMEQARRDDDALWDLQDYLSQRPRGRDLSRHRVYVSLRGAYFVVTLSACTGAMARQMNALPGSVRERVLGRDYLGRERIRQIDTWRVHVSHVAALDAVLDLIVAIAKGEVRP